MIKSYGFEKLLFFLIIISIAGCADRCEPPVLSADGTLVYPSKRANDVTAGISYYKNEDREKGEPLGVDTVFTLNEKDNIRTQILLSKNNLPAGKPMMFHLDWIGPDGRSFYTKRIDNTVNDVSPTVNSSVSLSPDKRVPGKYLLKVYYFRELIAEKHFTLITQHSVNHSLAQRFFPVITFCEKQDRKTGNYLGIDSVFIRDKNARVRAYVDLKNISEPLTFDLVWIGPDSNKFYSKDVEISPNEKPFTLYSAISIPADKRESGKYAIEVFLFDELIATKSFFLK